MTATTTRPEVSDPPRTGAEVLARAKALAPVLRARAADIEQARQLPADIVELIRATGVYRMGFAERWGGPAATSMTQVEVIEALAYGDASAGWCAAINGISGIMANFLDPECVPEVYPSPDAITTIVLAPVGRADKVDGGFRLSGQWTFASGITHADRVVCGAFIFENGEPYASPDGSNPHESRLFLVPQDRVEVIGGRWNTTGMCGTGSGDFTVTDVFVPEGHTLTFDNPRVPPGPLVTADAYLRSLPGVPMGVARAALDHAREVILGRTDRLTGVDWKDSWRAQVALAECEADFVAMRAGVLGSMRKQWEVLAAGGKLDDLSLVDRAASPLSWVHAFRVSKSIVQRLFDLLQTASIHKTGPMERWLRDISTMCQNVGAQDVVFESVGAYMLGRRPKFRFFLGIVD
ncbi:acyl-CoA dehydrogenase family protein [Actinokineospora enzanensis]|uniref:acyl-CoA dehydrogenase family protein n=1 Tax=Actinokineospora enzanensis TaxID=155975 RepID=UPI000361A458|nr:acyl-CoA dehydrogenase family protein [Actinokineospora enzanensis]